MALKMSQSLKQTQGLMMTPQLQQAIKLLTMTHLEMSNLLATEMVENPMLEEFGQEISPDDVKQEVDYNLEKLNNENKEATAEQFDAPEMMKGQDEFDWNGYIESLNVTSSSPPPSMSTPDLDELPNYENMVSRPMSLHEHLEWQLRMEDLSNDEMKVAYFTIRNLTDDGYLDIPFDEIVAQTEVSYELATDILERIQRLDPVGCGARNLTECLLAQAKLLDPRLPLVELIVRDHLDKVQSKDYNALVKKTGITLNKIKVAESVILMFNPKPGRLVSPEETQYIVPDIYVREVAGKWEIRLNNEGVPRLRISNLYKSMLKNKDSQTKEYVEEKLRAAMWLMKSVQNRRGTIAKVAEAIVKYQPEFFRKGSQYLKPMILKNIAQEIGMHESTVSRVTTNKYMHTPLGVFELKYFFNAGVGGKNGGIDIASESLKLKIKKLVDNEVKTKPLSDQKIVELLLKEDIKIARRTVAKYREMMSILPSSRRKRANTN